MAVFRTLEKLRDKTLPATTVSGPCTASSRRKSGNRVSADSTALDSVYSWKVIVTNKYAQADTLDVASKVVPYPDSAGCR